MEESKYCMVETAFDNEEEAKNGINILLYKKLASSCQMVESKSKWLWKGKVEESKEYLVFIKAKKSNLQEMWREIRKFHSYELFEFSVFDMTSIDPKYLEWIDSEG